MRLIFIDEFKPTVNKFDGLMTYGITAIVLDSAYYTNFKTGFINEIRKLGWSMDVELKGRDVYSKKKFENITPDQRIEFAEQLFMLSFSESGKNRRISVFIALDVFKKTAKEEEIYLDLLCRLFKKIGRPKDKKQDKNLVACFLDNNDSVAKKISESQLYRSLRDCLHKDWLIFERPFFVSSSNYLPGIVFADFVSYFHQNFLDTGTFFDKIKPSLVELIKKDESNLDTGDVEKLRSFLINNRKRENSKRVLAILKEIVYV